MRKQICVIGLGTIGLPLACILATSGYAVVGVDTNDEVVAHVQSAKVTFTEPRLQELLVKATSSGQLKASSTVIPSDIYIIAVPTYLDLNKQPVLSFVYTALDAIKPHLNPRDLILIESTCPIGTTEAIAETVRLICPGVYVAYCPERVLPGAILHELIQNDRIVGGVDEASGELAAAFYRSFVKSDVIKTDSRTAEAVKLAENSYRDVNIAYANELSMIADHAGLDVNKVIKLANRHPRVQILNPGPGVGGYCITVNPWFLVSSAPEQAKLLTRAREVNTEKTNWVIRKIKETIKRQKAQTVACLGLTYKADVSDIRKSPALSIIEALEIETKVLRIDPHVPNTVPLFEALSSAEIIVGLVAHSAFLNIPSHYLEGKVILDFAGIFS